MARIRHRVKTFSVPSGTTLRRFNSITSIRPPKNPSSVPNPRRVTIMTAMAMGPALGLSAISSATMATTAPTASSNTPSASKTTLTLRLTLKRLRSGLMTVGPVTMTNVPNKIEVRQSHSNNHRAVSIPPATVTVPPMVIIC